MFGRLIVLILSSSCFRAEYWFTFCILLNSEQRIDWFAAYLHCCAAGICRDSFRVICVRVAVCSDTEVSARFCSSVLLWLVPPCASLSQLQQHLVLLSLLAFCQGHELPSSEQHRRRAESAH
jgi:hypothetical protein